jgi:hypothetical protein
MLWLEPLWRMTFHTGMLIPRARGKHVVWKSPTGPEARARFFAPLLTRLRDQNDIVVAARREAVAYSDTYEQSHWWRLISGGYVVAPPPTILRVNPETRTTRRD